MDGGGEGRLDQGSEGWRSWPGAGQESLASERWGERNPSGQNTGKTRGGVRMRSACLNQGLREGVLAFLRFHFNHTH